MAKRIIKFGNVSPIVDFSRIATNAERTFKKQGRYGISLSDACGIRSEDNVEE
jgi:hypothetical protein